MFRTRPAFPPAGRRTPWRAGPPLGWACRPGRQRLSWPPHAGQSPRRVQRGTPWLDSDKELIEIINCRLTVSGAEKVRKSEMLNRCFPNLFRLRLSVHFADVQNL